MSLFDPTPDELAILLEHTSDPKRREQIKKALAFELRFKLIRKLPSPRGTCSGQFRVVIDDGPHGSGYILHQKGFGVCQHDEVAWDEDPPQVKRLKAMIEAL